MNWTTSEIKYLIDIAGHEPLSEICRELHRSEYSVQSKANILRKLGFEVSLRYYKNSLAWCPQCATWRSRIFKTTGLCLVCRLRNRLNRCKQDCERALDNLSEEERSDFLRHSLKKGSLIPPRPSKPKPKNSSFYESEKAEAIYALDMEKREVVLLSRQINAEKSRLLRIRSKLHSLDQEVRG